jgi:hypothetical protein
MNYKNPLELSIYKTLQKLVISSEMANILRFSHTPYIEIMHPSIFIHKFVRGQQLDYVAQLVRGQQLDSEAQLVRTQQLDSVA